MNSLYRYGCYAIKFYPFKLCIVFSTMLCNLTVYILVPNNKDLDDEKSSFHRSTNSQIFEWLKAGKVVISAWAITTATITIVDNHNHVDNQQHPP